jgi:hypothetical protein
MRCKTTKVGAEVDSIDGVRLGYEREVEEDNDADKRAQTSATQRERRRARRLRLRVVGPAHYATRGRGVGLSG